MNVRAMPSADPDHGVLQRDERCGGACQETGADHAAHPGNAYNGPVARNWCTLAKDSVDRGTSRHPAAARGQRLSPHIANATTKRIQGTDTEHKISNTSKHSKRLKSVVLHQRPARRLISLIHGAVGLGCDHEGIEVFGRGITPAVDTKPE
jgi:hypothetical protein